MDPRGEGELHSSTGLVAPGLNQHRRLRGNWRTDWALAWEAAAPLCRTKALLLILGIRRGLQERCKRVVKVQTHGLGSEKSRGSSRL